MRTEPLQITCINSVSDLTPYLDVWRKLAAGAPMRSPEWLLGWWENFTTPDDRLCVLLLHESDGALIGLAPLYLQGVSGCRTFRILGAADNCTHHNNWLTAEGWEDRVGRGVAGYFLDRRSEWQRLVFNAVDADATAVHATLNCLAENGCLQHYRPINSCWKITLPTTWDDYLAMLSGSLRKRCRKLQREFLDSGVIQLRQVESEAELREGFDILLKLHETRWGKTMTPLGVFSDRRFLKFHENMARKLLARKQLRLAWLECAGRPIAIEYQFFDDNAVYAYLAGIDLEQDEYSSGKLTMMAAIRFAVERGCKYFDLLGGDEGYKANWRAAPIPCHDLRVWQKKGRGAIEWRGWNGYTWVIRRLKPLLPQRLVELGLKSVQGLQKVISIFGRTGR